MRYGCSFHRCSKLLLRGGSVGCFSLVWLCHSFCLYVCLRARKVREPRAGAASQCEVVAPLEGECETGSPDMIIYIYVYIYIYNSYTSIYKVIYIYTQHI